MARWCHPRHRRAGCFRPPPLARSHRPRHRHPWARRCQGQHRVIPSDTRDFPARDSDRLHSNHRYRRCPGNRYRQGSRTERKPLRRRCRYKRFRPGKAKPRSPTNSTPGPGRRTARTTRPCRVVRRSTRWLRSRLGSPRRIQSSAPPDMSRPRHRTQRPRRCTGCRSSNRGSCSDGRDNRRCPEPRRPSTDSRCRWRSNRYTCRGRQQRSHNKENPAHRTWHSFRRCTRCPLPCIRPRPESLRNREARGRRNCHTLRRCKHHRPGRRTRRPPTGKCRTRSNRRWRSCYHHSRARRASHTQARCYRRFPRGLRHRPRRSRLRAPRLHRRRWIRPSPAGRRRPDQNRRHPRQAGHRRPRSLPCWSLRRRQAASRRADKSRRCKSSRSTNGESWPYEASKSGGTHHARAEPGHDTRTRACCPANATRRDPWVPRGWLTEHAPSTNLNSDGAMEPVLLPNRRAISSSLVR